MQLKLHWHEIRDFHWYFVWTCIEDCNDTREAAEMDTLLATEQNIERSHNIYMSVQRPKKYFNCFSISQLINNYMFPETEI